jgi:uncharacterized membrane protein
MQRVGFVAILFLWLMCGLATPGLVSAHEGQVAAPSAGVNIEQLVAWLGLAILLASLIVGIARIWRYRAAWFGADPPGALRDRANKWVLALGLVGLIIAGYLAYHKLTATSIACGPLAGCDTVQESRYSLLLGVPMGVWGVLGYSGILLLWGLGEYGPRRLAFGRWNRPVLQWMLRRSRAVLLGLSLFTVIFSTYLTALELVVIRATCTWCIGSAVTTAAICWALILDRGWLPTVVLRKPKRRRKAR